MTFLQIGRRIGGAKGKRRRGASPNREIFRKILKTLDNLGSGARAVKTCRTANPARICQSPISGPMWTGETPRELGIFGFTHDRLPDEFIRDSDLIRSRERSGTRARCAE